MAICGRKFTRRARNSRLRQRCRLYRGRVPRVANRSTGHGSERSNQASSNWVRTYKSARRFRLKPHARRHLTFQSAHHFRHPTLGHLLHHLAHLQMLLEQAVDVLNLYTTPHSDAALARPFDHRREAALMRRHRIDDGYPASSESKRKSAARRASYYGANSAL